MRKSIQVRLLLTFIALSTIPLLLVGIIVAWQSFNTQQQQAFGRQRQEANRIAVQVSDYVSGLKNQLSTILQTRGLQGLERSQQKIVLEQLLNFQNDFEELALLDENGQEQVRVARATVISDADLVSRADSDEYLQAIATGKDYYGPVEINPATDEPFMTLALPILNLRTGKVSNILVTNIRFKPIWDLLATINTEENDTFYILDGENDVVAHADPSVVLKKTQFIVPDEGSVQTGLAGTQVILGMDTIRFGDQNFRIVAEIPAADALALAINAVIVTAIIVLTALVAAIVVGLLAVNQIVKPVLALVGTAQSIQRGDFTKRAPLVSQDEIGQLAFAFNEMTDAVQKRENELRQQAEELKFATAKAEEAARIKSEFLATMSHELRTPLNAIIGFTAIVLMNDAMTPQDKQKIQRVEANSQRLLSLINDILDISKMESGHMELTPTTFSLASLVKKLQSQLGVLAENKGLNLSVAVDHALDTVCMDEDAVTKIITNLVSNGIKFTDAGDVSLTVNKDADKLVIRVTDTGIGIPAHKLNIIFESFRQVDSSTSRRFGGSGLGLSIVRHLCTAMNGSIAVSSNVGQGSTFTVTLPLNSVIEAQQQTEKL